jgi:hypothetical protein
MQTFVDPSRTATSNPSLAIAEDVQTGGLLLEIDEAKFEHHDHQM